MNLQMLKTKLPLRLSAKTLARYCDYPRDYFWSKYPTFGKRKSERHAFVDNGSKVLAVAHLDSVMDLKAIRTGSTVWSPALDDRLGAYMMIEALPQLGVKMDWLLTDNEERCRSTAEYFEPSKDYNWIVGFDRGGTDVVMYQYHDPKWEDPLAEVGMSLHRGSYSDIAVLEHLGVTGFNWGTGYERAHSRDCHADLRVTAKLVRKFARFFAKWQDVRFPYEAPPRITYKRVSRARGDFEKAYGELLAKYGLGQGFDADRDGWAAYHDEPSAADQLALIEQKKEDDYWLGFEDPVHGWIDHEEVEEVERLVERGGSLTPRQKCIFDFWWGADF